MTKIKINDTEYEAVINGQVNDHLWDGRESKAITLEMTHATANELFVDDAEWSILDGETEYDNSEFRVAGDITDHRDGTLTVKMGKSTDLELAYEELYGGL